MASLISTSCALGLAAMWIWSGTAKIIKTRSWQAQLRSLHLPRSLRAAGVLLLPWVELAMADLLMARPALGAIASIGLLTVLSGAIVWARAHESTNVLGCGCFGGSAARDYRLTLLRNSGLLALALGVLGLSEKPSYLLTTPASFGVLVSLVLVAVTWTMRRLGEHVTRHGWTRASTHQDDSPSRA